MLPDTGSVNGAIAFTVISSAPQYSFKPYDETSCPLLSRVTDLQYWQVSSNASHDVTDHAIRTNDTVNTIFFFIPEFFSKDTKSVIPIGTLIMTLFF